MSGFSHRSNGPMIREVCCDDSEPVEPEKMRAIQIITGSQYLRNTAPLLTG